MQDFIIEQSITIEDIEKELNDLEIKKQKLFDQKRAIQNNDRASQDSYLISLEWLKDQQAQIVNISGEDITLEIRIAAFDLLKYYRAYVRYGGDTVGLYPTDDDIIVSVSYKTAISLIREYNLTIVAKEREVNYVRYTNKLFQAIGLPQIDCLAKTP